MFRTAGDGRHLPTNEEGRGDPRPSRPAGVGQGTSALARTLPGSSAVQVGSTTTMRKWPGSVPAPSSAAMPCLPSSVTGLTPIGSPAIGHVVRVEAVPQALLVLEVAVVLLAVSWPIAAAEVVLGQRERRLGAVPGALGVAGCLGVLAALRARRAAGLVAGQRHERDRRGGGRRGQHARTPRRHPVAPLAGGGEVDDGGHRSGVGGAVATRPLARISASSAASRRAAYCAGIGSTGALPSLAEPDLDLVQRGQHGPRLRVGVDLWPQSRGLGRVEDTGVQIGEEVDRPRRPRWATRPLHAVCHRPSQRRRTGTPRPSTAPSGTFASASGFRR